LHGHGSGAHPVKGRFNLELPFFLLQFRQYLAEQRILFRYGKGSNVLARLITISWVLAFFSWLYLHR
jgi:hypothetical protein